MTEIEFFSQLHEDLTDQPVDLDDIGRSLEESGIDVTVTVAAGLKLIADAADNADAAPN